VRSGPSLRKNPPLARATVRAQPANRPSRIPTPARANPAGSENGKSRSDASGNIGASAPTAPGPRRTCPNIGCGHRYAPSAREKTERWPPVTRTFSLLADCSFTSRRLGSYLKSSASEHGGAPDVVNVTWIGAGWPRSTVVGPTAFYRVQPRLEHERRGLRPLLRRQMTRNAREISSDEETRVRSRGRDLGEREGACPVQGTPVAGQFSVGGSTRCTTRYSAGPVVFVRRIPN
jgi:hypothetical protein